MTLMLSLLEEHDVSPRQIKSINVRTSENIHRTLLHHHPHTELEAKFSLEFCLAALAVERRLGLMSFTDEFVCRPEVQELIARVKYTTFTESEARAAGYTIVTTLVEIELHDGRVIGGCLNYGKGSKTNPMTQAEVEAKFRDCAGFVNWPREKTDRVIALVNSLENQKNMEELMKCLAG